MDRYLLLTLIPLDIGHLHSRNWCVLPLLSAVIWVSAYITRTCSILSQWKRQWRTFPTKISKKHHLSQRTSSMEAGLKIDGPLGLWRPKNLLSCPPKNTICWNIWIKSCARLYRLYWENPKISLWLKTYVLSSNAISAIKNSEARDLAPSLNFARAKLFITPQ